MRWLAVLLVACVAGCGVNPIPEPPFERPPALAGDVVGAVCDECDGAPLELTGAPGSVTDADVVWAVNLDGTAPPVVAPVAADGSFALDIDGLQGDELRLQARRGALRSEPVDLIAGVGALEPSPRPLAGCFEVERELALPEAAVGAMSSSAIALAHSCGAPLAIDRIALRAPAPEYSLEGTAAPVVLEAGSAGELRVVYRPTEAAARGEEVALIEVSSPEVFRRAVTLFVAGAP